LDLLIILSDPSMRGLETAFRVLDLMKELRSDVGASRLLITRMNGDVPPALQAAAEKRGVEIWGTIPDDSEIRQLDAEGKPLIQVSAENATLRIVQELLSGAS
jgi:CO dehydrogenase maturation factor